MAELLCLRSLWETLISAASTFALFVAANWGTAGLIAWDSDLYTQILGHTVLIFGTPMFSLGLSIWNALVVWRVKRRLDAEVNNPHYDTSSIAIIMLSPLYIQVPKGLPHSSNLKPVIDSEEFKDVCPLVLRPSHAATRRTTNTDADKIPPNTDGASGDTTNTDGAAQGTIDAATTLHVEDSTQWMCSQLPGTSFLDVAGVVSVAYVVSDAIEQRLAILRSHLAPSYKELSIIRSRNMFQSMVTTLQAGGYMLSVLQRIVQGLGISPVEAIIAFLCIIVTVQLLIELYACGSYQRPLVLRLDASQFECFCDARRQILQVPKRENVVWALLLLMWFLISIPAIYYFSHYVHTYFICALSAFIFFLAQMLLAIFLAFGFFLNEFNEKYYGLLRSLLHGSGLLYAMSMIVAVVSTAVDWKAFHKPVPHNWFAWILPHASS